VRRTLINISAAIDEAKLKDLILQAVALSKADKKIIINNPTDLFINDC
jgi:hypothetical protein